MSNNQSEENSKNVKPWDILKKDTEYASEEVANFRYNTCLSCPELIKLTKQCKQCGCFMTIKTKLQAATCPLEKW